MSLTRLLHRTVSLALLSLLAVVLAQSATAGRLHHGKSPFIAIGPQAMPVDAANPQLSLFTCQVGLSSVTCYDPYQMRRAYGVDQLVNAGYTGAGHTIVVVDAFQSPTLVSDVNIFSANYGLPPASAFLTQIAPDGLTPFAPTDANMVGWSGEITLDVEWAHGIAPGANVVLVLAKSNQDADILSALKYAVDHNLGDVVSMSFGENESCLDPAAVSAYHDVFVAATQKGITLFASSGDDGAAQQTCDGASWVQAVSHPASDPLVSGVGGTELHAAGYCLPALGCNPATHPLPGTYAGEIVWNEFQQLSTGGGYSVIFDEPPYQKSAIKGKQRAVPDVAYNAAVYHGVLTVWQGVYYLFGGTSAGAPQWAGIAAIANQKAGQRLGYLNSAFYQIRQVTKAYPASFHDIVSGDNSVVLDDANGNPVAITGFAAGNAWDASTGIGSPIDGGLVDYMIKYVSPGDAVSAIATSKPHANNKPAVPGHAHPH
jgi:subtilase family serine protease